MKYTIKQAKCLKLDLERIGRRETIEMDKDLIVKLDIEAMYPSITYELVAEAVRYYAEGFSEEETARVEAGLDMLKFSMSNCLINFREKYLQYGKEKDPLKRVLTIGGYDSAWLADLTACYILERAEPVWSEQFEYFKIYRDDGCGLARNTTVKKLCKWYDIFQQEVDRITGGIIKFTLEIWKPSDEKERKVNDVIKVLGGNSTPYLDADLFFNEKRELGIRVYFKEEYTIKYVGADSVHTKATKKAVIKSQCIRTAELTTRTPTNENSSLSDLYPDIDAALREAGLLKGKTKLPKLGTVLDAREEDTKLAAEEKKEEKDG